MRAGHRTQLTRVLVFALAMAALALGGCAESDLHQYLGRSDTLSVGAGNAQEANKAIQVVDRWPVESRKNKIDLDGKRAAIAIQRYEKNQSIEPSGLTKRNANTGPPDPGVPDKQ